MLQKIISLFRAWTVLLFVHLKGSPDKPVVDLTVMMRYSMFSLALIRAIVEGYSIWITLKLAELREMSCNIGLIHLSLTNAFSFAL